MEALETVLNCISELFTGIESVRIIWHPVISVLLMSDSKGLGNYP